jgi:fatty acid desaturase
MPDKTPENELREIWRSQSTEQMEMKLGSPRLRQRARDLRSKSRRELLNSIMLAVLIAAGSVYGSIWTHSPVARASFAVTAVWVLIGQFFLHRTKRQASPPEDAGLRTSLDSCRRELERHIRFDRGVHLWLAGPLILAFGTLIGALVVAVGGKDMLLKMAGPVLALLVVFALGMVVFRRSQEREFRRAIEELNQIERER